MNPDPLITSSLVDVEPDVGWQSPKVSAFTLVELLTVIVIISILVAIGVPVISSIRKSGDSAKCISNLRQLAIATQSFVVEQQLYPERRASGDDGSWVSPDVSQYLQAGKKLGELGSLRSVYVCPAAHRSANGKVPDANDVEWADRTYGFNRYICGKAPSTIPNPAHTALLADGVLARTGQTDSTKWNPYIDIRGWVIADAVHGKQLQIAYCDGHVAAARWETIPLTDRKANFWSGEAESE